MQTNKKPRASRKRKSGDDNPLPSPELDEGADKSPIKKAKTEIKVKDEAWVSNAIITAITTITTLDDNVHIEGEWNEGSCLAVPSQSVHNCIPTR